MTATRRSQSAGSIVAPGRESADVMETVVSVWQSWFSVDLLRLRARSLTSLLPGKREMCRESEIDAAYALPPRLAFLLALLQIDRFCFDSTVIRLSGQMRLTDLSCPR
jgi:hypothetical protein